MLKVIAACGNGMGSSLMVQMKIKEVLAENNVEANVEHMSVGDVKNQGANADVVFVSSALEPNLTQLKEKTIVIGLKNLLSKDEILEKLQANNVID